MKDLSGLAAVVTGGASGLGEATARMLAVKGAKVAILDVNPEAGPRIAGEIGGMFAETDVTSSVNVAQTLEKVVGAFGTPRICINCAGIATGAKTIDRDGNAHNPALFEKAIRVNLIGTFNVASQCAALMAAAEPLTDDGERGVIINTASVAAFDGQVGQIAYGASKGGVAAMTLPMARDLSRNGIRVCAIAPGLFQTPMADGLPEEVITSLAAQVPFPSRFGLPSEYAELALALVTNPMMNGEVIRIDGAIRLAPR
jgi:NAD(P)-dependent dehydrogenase (short-subunit alcohol dehydrogenase family)